MTGASSGIGREIARRLAEEGAALVLVARRKERLDALAAELSAAHGVEVRVEAADLTVPGAAVALFDALEGTGVSVDILVNNAGIGEYRPFLEADWARWSHMIQLNVVALTELCRRWAPQMVARGRGHVMNVSSIGAWFPAPTFAVYTATKAFVRNFTEAFDAELVGSGVRAIAVCPGGTQTEFMEQANQTMKAGSDKFMMSARACADVAVDQMIAGRRLVVTGFLNVLMVWLARWLPRSWLPAVSDLGMKMGVERTR